MTIQKVLPVSERQYVDRQGQQQGFVSRGIVFSDGIDTIYGELIGEQARRNDLAPDMNCCVQMTCAVREWEDKNHTTRYSNELIINRIGL